MDDIAKRLLDGYLEFVCQMVGIDAIEGYRRYQTDVSFRTGLDALVNVALAVVNGGEDTELLNIDLFHETAKVDKEPLWKAFQEGLLGA